VDPKLHDFLLLYSSMYFATLSKFFSSMDFSLKRSTEDEFKRRVSNNFCSTGNVGNFYLINVIPVEPHHHQLPQLLRPQESLWIIRHLLRLLPKEMGTKIILMLAI